MAGMDFEGLDSDDLIPPKLHAAPHSLVPFSKSPISMALTGPPSSTIGTAVVRANTASTVSGGSGGGNAAAGSAPSSAGGVSIVPGSMGSASGTLGSPRASEEHATLPHMPWKDWELNLDALQVGQCLHA